jgi:hypothetical protein
MLGRGRAYGEQIGEIEAKRRSERDAKRFGRRMEADDGVERAAQAGGGGRQEAAVAREEQLAALDVHAASDHIVAPKSRPVRLSSSPVHVTSPVVSMIPILHTPPRVTLSRRTITSKTKRRSPILAHILDIDSMKTHCLQHQ